VEPPERIAERERALALAAVDAIAVYPIREVYQEGGRPPHGNILVLCALTVRVTCWARGTTSLRPSQAVDPLLAWAVKALSGQRYGGLAHDTDQAELELDYDLGETPFVRASQDFVVTYQHLKGNAESTT